MLVSEPTLHQPDLLFWMCVNEACEMSPMVALLPKKSSGELGIQNHKIDLSGTFRLLHPIPMFYGSEKSVPRERAFLIRRRMLSAKFPAQRPELEVITNYD